MALVNGEDLPLKKGKYMKFKQGENIFRILGSGISGYEFWVEKDGKRNPIRVKTAKEAEKQMGKSDDPRNAARYFQAYKVWNYDEKAVQILEITQRGIQATIGLFYDNPKWGSPTEYDITVLREGEKLDTKYQTSPNPKEELPKDIKKTCDDTYVNLDAIFTGEDPFTSNTSGVSEETIEAKDLPF